ncbi:folate-binding protein [Sphingobium sp. DEHP117]|uniref:CAF17-like 4Fe-4S cluster assembly/insertion protein YgfZ n=1 Tax=Sphingobium sp. DEHP117 TaxID=2993436 RepID=UPI0027D5F443|nr:folate-binding protein [Sphingobium sp. DEHP117]MDQ4419149.1 folate-binding protein [Sphingobium sp. DEHP117]
MADTTLKDRALIRLSGEEARAFLQGLVTQDVLGLEADSPRWSGLLTPQGKALYDFVLWADGDDVLMDCEETQADALAKRLSIYRLRRKVVIARDEALAVHWSLDAPNKPYDPRLMALGHRWLAPADEGDAASAFRAHRLSLGVTEGVTELGSDKTLWLEANARELNGVDFAKGCYVGQENTARMHYRQKVNRRLVVVPIAQSDPARQMAAFPDLGLAVDHRRVEDMVALPLPGWLAEAIADAPV